MNLILMMVLGGMTMLTGLVGCFVPVIPGPAVAYAGLWILFAFGCPPPLSLLIVGAAVLAVVMLVDYVLPSVCARRFNCTRWGVFGCFAGGIAGIFFIPWGLVLGPFCGTVLGELIAGKNLAASVRGGLGALLGFVLCLGLKLGSVGLYAWWYFASLPYSAAS